MDQSTGYSCTSDDATHRKIGEAFSNHKSCYSFPSNHHENAFRPHNKGDTAEEASWALPLSSAQNANYANAFLGLAYSDTPAFANGMFHDFDATRSSSNSLPTSTPIHITGLVHKPCNSNDFTSMNDMKTQHCMTQISEYLVPCDGTGSSKGFFHTNQSPTTNTVNGTPQVIDVSLESTSPNSQLPRSNNSLSYRTQISQENSKKQATRCVFQSSNSCNFFQAGKTSRSTERDQFQVNSSQTTGFVSDMTTHRDQIKQALMAAFGKGLKRAQDQLLYKIQLEMASSGTIFGLKLDSSHDNGELGQVTQWLGANCEGQDKFESAEIVDAILEDMEKGGPIVYVSELSTAEPVSFAILDNTRTSSALPSPPVPSRSLWNDSGTQPKSRPRETFTLTGKSKILTHNGTFVESFECSDGQYRILDEKRARQARERDHNAKTKSTSEPQNSTNSYTKRKRRASTTDVRVCKKNATSNDPAQNTCHKTCGRSLTPALTSDGVVSTSKTTSSDTITESIDSVARRAKAQNGMVSYAANIAPVSYQAPALGQTDKFMNHGHVNQINDVAINIHPISKTGPGSPPILPVMPATKATSQSHPSVIDLTDSDTAVPLVGITDTCMAKTTIQTAKQKWNDGRAEKKSSLEERIAELNTLDKSLPQSISLAYIEPSEESQYPVPRAEAMKGNYGDISYLLINEDHKMAAIKIYEKLTKQRFQIASGGKPEWNSKAQTDSNETRAAAIKLVVAAERPRPGANSINEQSAGTVTLRLEGKLNNDAKKTMEEASSLNDGDMNSPAIDLELAFMEANEPGMGGLSAKNHWSREADGAGLLSDNKFDMNPLQKMQRQSQDTVVHGLTLHKKEEIGFLFDDAATQTGKLKGSHFAVKHLFSPILADSRSSIKERAQQVNRELRELPAADLTFGDMDLVGSPRQGCFKRCYDEAADMEQGIAHGGWDIEELMSTEAYAALCLATYGSSA